MMTNSFQIIEHISREANLLAAKRAVRSNRRAHMHRHTDFGEDVIDIIVGADIIERHVCHTAEPVVPVARSRRFCIEELALYR